MVEQKLFKKYKETNCDIFFLVRKDDKIRLMSYKSNPWRRFSEKSIETTDSDVCKQSLFLFSGSLMFVPSGSSEKDKANRTENENIKKYSRRFDNDKV